MGEGVGTFRVSSGVSEVTTAHTAITIMLRRNNKTPRKAVGMLPMGGDGSILVTEEGAAMYVEDPNQSTNVIRAKTIERGFIPSSFSTLSIFKIGFQIFGA